MSRRAAVLGVLLAACHPTTSDHDPRRVLDTVRPVGAPALVQRGAALRRLGRLRDARDELLIALSLDPRAAVGHRELGLVEAELGNLGASLRLLERAVQLGQDSPCSRRDLALLLAWRGWYRLLSRGGFHQRDDAERDLRRAATLAPCVAPRVQALLAGPGLEASRPECPGIRSVPLAARPPPPGPCRIRGPERHLAVLRRRDLLLGCRGPGLAHWLESAGCPAAARQVWSALVDEAPAEPRWVLELARALLLAGEMDRARPLLTNHVYLSQDRAAALLRVSHTLEAVGLPRAAARRAVQAMAFARRLPQQIEALRVLTRTARPDQIRQAARAIEAGDWPGGRARVRRLVDQTIRRAVPRRTPRQ